jgi:transcriptional antiterminator NusG
MDINENEEQVLGEVEDSTPEPNKIEISQETDPEAESISPDDDSLEAQQAEAVEESLDEDLHEAEQEEEEPASEGESSAEEIQEETEPMDSEAEAVAEEEEGSPEEDIEESSNEVEPALEAEAPPEEILEEVEPLEMETEAEADLEEDQAEIVSGEVEALPAVDEEKMLDTAETEIELEVEPLADEEKEDSPEEAVETTVDVETDEEVEQEEDLVEERKLSAVPEKDDGRAWYVVHCYSGNEDKVRFNILQRIESMGMDDLIFDVVVPTEDEVNIKNGERQTVEKKVFPGYILVNMILTEESWYMVRNTPGVTGFVGMGNDPTPLQTEEVARILKRMESESPRINVTFRPGERVRIVDGPFEDFYGKVSEIDMERATVRVMVNFFGRETPVELDFLQVEEA